MSSFWSSIFGEEQKQANSKIDVSSPGASSDASQNSWDLISNSNSNSNSGSESENNLSPVPEEDSFIGDIFQLEDEEVDTNKSVNYGAVAIDNVQVSDDSLNGIYYDPEIRGINSSDKRMDSPLSLLVAREANSDSESDLGEVEDLGYMCCSGINNCIDSISKSFNNCATSFFDRWVSCCFDEDITDNNKTYKKVVSVEV